MGVVGPKEASRPLAQDLCLSLRRWGKEFVLCPMGRKVGAYVKGDGRQGMEARGDGQREGKSPKVKASIYRINTASGKATNNAGTIAVG